MELFVESKGGIEFNILLLFYLYLLLFYFNLCVLVDVRISSSLIK